MNKEKLLSFATSGIAALALATITLLSMKSLFEMLSFTSTGAWLLGTAVAFVPAFFINRVLTKAYVDTCDVQDANEFSSFTGTLGTVSLAIIAGLWLGFAGTRGSEALSMGIRETGSAVGLLEPAPAIKSANHGEKLTSNIMDMAKSLTKEALQETKEPAIGKGQGMPLESGSGQGQGQTEGFQPNYNQQPPQNFQNWAPPQGRMMNNQQVPEMVKNSGSGNVTIYY